MYLTQHHFSISCSFSNEHTGAFIHPLPWSTPLLSTSAQWVLWKACAQTVWWQQRQGTCHVAWGGISQKNYLEDEVEKSVPGKEVAFAKDRGWRLHYLPIQETGSPSVNLECWVKAGGAVGTHEVAQAGRGLILRGVWTLFWKLCAGSGFCWWIKQHGEQQEQQTRKKLNWVQKWLSLNLIYMYLNPSMSQIPYF